MERGPPETGFACLGSQLLAASQVVTNQLFHGDTPLIAHLRIGEIENREIGDLGPTDTTPDLERGDLSLSPMAEQLGPAPRSVDDAYQTPGSPILLYRPS